jgi:hypothetical protein
VSRERLPDRAHGAAEALRRTDPPPGLLESLMIEVEATPQERPFRLTWLRVASVTAATAVVAVMAVIGISRLGNLGHSTSSSGAPSGSAAPTSIHLPSVPIDQLPVAGAVEIELPMPDGAHPSSADERSVWVGNEATGEVLRIDATTGETVGRVKVNQPTTELYSLVPVSDGTSVWAAGFDDRSLVRIDIGAIEIVDRWPIDAVPYRIAPAGSVLWVTDFDNGRVLSVRAGTGQILTTTPWNDATGIAVAADTVWAADYFGRLARIDPESGRIIETFRIASDATDVQVVGSDLWITGINGRRLERFDPTRGDVAAWMDHAWAVAFVHGRPWATVEGGLVRLDPATLEMDGAVPLPNAETDQMVAADGRLWAYGGTPAGTVLYAVRPSG